LTKPTLLIVEDLVTNSSGVPAPLNLQLEDAVFSQSKLPNYEEDNVNIHRHSAKSRGGWKVQSVFQAAVMDEVEVVDYHAS
jgi:sulfur relay (sulfurtransferase) DsrF/TusC family protein